MTAELSDLFAHNRAWAAQQVAAKPTFFTDLLAQQTPRYMWIGCADSRVPANEITGLAPGEVFVHRNVANVVVPTDLNCLSTVQYAVDQLKVEHLMVVGHYGCGGVTAAMRDWRIGLADNWLHHIKNVRDRHAALLADVPFDHQPDVLCELNVIEQVVNVAETTVVQDAWARGQRLTLHGWVYGLRDGLLQDLHTTVSAPAELAPRYHSAVAAVAAAARRLAVCAAPDGAPRHPPTGLASRAGSAPATVRPPVLPPANAPSGAPAHDAQPARAAV